MIFLLSKGATPVSVLICALLLCSTTPAFSQPRLLPEKKGHKDDVVVLDNGDRLTGEIKKVQNGILYLKSDRALGTLQLDWNRVRFLQSSARYELEDVRGARPIGTISPGSIEGRIVLILDDESAIQMSLSEILEIREMSQSFFGRLNLELDAGDRKSTV